MRCFLSCLAAVLCCFVLGAETIDWSEAPEVQAGVRLVKRETDQPRLQKINLMRIDLRTGGLEFTGSARDPDWGKPMPDWDKAVIRTRRIRTRDFLLNARRPAEEGGQGLNMIVAANSAPWWPWTKPYTHKYAHPAGLGILNGEVICDTRPHKAVFVVYEDGRADIVSSVPESDYRSIRVAASGFAIILRDGEILEGGSCEKEPMPRIAYGLSEDRRYLYIVTVDGRQKGWSLGATGKETAALLKEAGAADAINMDGGGSATLCYWDEKTKTPVTVNRQTESGYQRPVGSNIGIYLK